MVHNQPAQRIAGVGEVADWMAQRRRQVAHLGPRAEAAGRNLWAQAIRTGQDLAAPNPRDVVSLGARFLSNSVESGNQASRSNSGTAMGGAARTKPSVALVSPDMSGRRRTAPVQFTPSSDVSSLRDLREKQAQFARERNRLDIQNSWLAVWALAPAAIGLAMEAPSLLAFGRIGSALRAPLTSLPELESWQNASQLEARIGRSLTEAEKTALRRLARSR